ncbi:MAG: glycosyltransferase [Rouxiella badensis]|uniref:glycosyltransferase family 2 protein n=1 Tax=Rouxiella badensis TaxID=1646377 RepID=UPI003C66B2A0
MPLVTVYITTCNRLELLKRCVSSILSQTIKDIEVIVVDDFSSDNTKDYLEEMSHADHRFSYILNDERKGACYSRNMAIKAAQGEYITGCDDDDYFTKDRVETFLKNSSLLNKYSMLYTDSIWIDGQKERKANINKFAGNTPSANDLIFFNFVGNQVFMKSEILKKYLFDESMPAWQDLECWFRILRRERKHAYRLNVFNYYQDISHEYGRISDGKKDRVLDAYNLFCYKHELSSSEKKSLKCHFFNYGFGKEFFIKSTFYSLITRPTMFKIILTLRNAKVLYS